MSNHTPIKPDSQYLDFIDTYYRYCPITGIVESNSKMNGYRKIGNLDSDGYLRTTVKDNKVLKLHHICWYLYYGEWPYCQIDHKDRDRTNNRINNLQLSMPHNQLKNISTQSEYGTGISKKSNGYEVSVRFNGERYYIGLFPTVERAKIERFYAQEKYGQYEMFSRIEMGLKIR